MFADHDDNLAFAVGELAAVDPVLFQIGRADVAPDIATVDARFVVIVADDAPLKSSAIASRNLWSRTNALL